MFIVGSEISFRYIVGIVQFIPVWLFQEYKKDL